MNMTGKEFLFLDRDGVINTHRPGDYVKSVDEFTFLPGAIEAVSVLSKKFRRIIIVTNQRGISKGKMTEADLQMIHDHMLQTITAHGGQIDAIYYATAPDDNDAFRKPNSGMAMQAQKDFAEIDFAKSIMVGDSLSDIEFGKRLRMTTVFIQKNDCKQRINADYTFPSLFAFALSLEIE